MNQLGKFNGVLLVSDFDDTLYGEDMRITRENVEALTYFTREGGTFTVATGRARPNFAPHASHIPINAPVILSNGSALYDFRTGEMIYETGSRITGLLNNGASSTGHGAKTTRFQSLPSFPSANS